MDQKLCQTNGEFPASYDLRPDGLWIMCADGSSIRATYTWLRVISRARTPQGDGWSYTIAYADGDENLSEITIPSTDLIGAGSAGLKSLVGAGVDICPEYEKKVLSFIRESRPGRRDLLIPSTGWVDQRNLFVMPSQVMGDTSGERVIYRPEVNSPTEKSMHPQGTLDDGKKNVAALTQGNPYLIFALLASLSAVLLRFLGLDGGGFNLFGPSSRGKTTFLQVGSSCFGNGSDPASNADSYIRRWNVTGNAVEALGAAHNDTLLALDELGTFFSKGIDALVYNLTGGQGKAAMTTSRQLQKQRAWTCLILSTGEISFKAKIEAGGSKVMAGQLIRMIDIAAGDTIFHDTHGMEPADFANCIKNACSTWYGAAGPAFVSEIVAQRDCEPDLRAALLDALEQFTVELTPEGLLPEQARAVRRFALLRLAGELAVQFNILPLTDEDILAAVTFVRDRWLSTSENQVSDTDRAIKTLQEFIIRNHSAFPNTTDPKAKASNARGFFNPENGWYLFTEDQLKAASGCDDDRRVARALRDKRLLVTHEGGRLRVKQNLACLGKSWPRFYGVRAVILDQDFGFEIVPDQTKKQVPMIDQQSAVDPSED